MDRRIPLDSVFSTLYLVGMSESKQQDRREDMGASKPVCVKCGMPVQRDWSGWSHVLPPMSPREARKFRHVVRVAS